MNEVFWKATEGEVSEFFWKMKDDEAKAFFDQYVQLADERLTLLKQRFRNCGGGTGNELDFTPESLVPLWRWAMGQFGKREHTAEELEHIMSLPDWFRQEQMARKRLSEGSLVLIIDIAYYFAEVFIRNHPGVHWIINRTKVKRLYGGNQPVLAGFTPPMDPRNLVKVAALKTLDGRAGEEELFVIHNIWTENLEKRPRK